MARMFISHSTRDRAFVERELLTILEALGFNTWFAETDISSAEQWERSILSALRSSKWLVLVMSRSATESEWVKDEVAFAIDEYPDRILPILIEDCDLRSIHIRLPRIQFVDFRTDKTKAVQDLVRTLVNAEYKPFVRDLATSNEHKRLLHTHWQPLVDGGLQIVMGRFLAPGFEQSGLVGTGDASAMSELRSTLESVGLPPVPVAYSDQVVGDSLRTNLILLGGPDPNTLTLEASKRLPTTIRFGDARRREVSFYDAKDRKYYSPKQSRSNQLEIDLGLLICCANPFASTKRLIVAAGSFGHGTWACIRFLLSKDYFKHELAGQDAEFLLKTDVLWGSPQQNTLLLSRTLNRDA